MCRPLSSRRSTSSCICVVSSAFCQKLASIPLSLGRSVHSVHCEHSLSACLSVCVCVCLSVCLSHTHTHARTHARTHTHTHTLERPFSGTQYIRQETVRNSGKHSVSSPASSITPPLPPPPPPTPPPTHTHTKEKKGGGGGWREREREDSPNSAKTTH